MKSRFEISDSSIVPLRVPLPVPPVASSLPVPPLSARISAAVFLWKSRAARVRLAAGGAGSLVPTHPDSKFVSASRCSTVLTFGCDRASQPALFARRYNSSLSHRPPAALQSELPARGLSPDPIPANPQVEPGPSQPRRRRQ